MRHELMIQGSLDSALKADRDRPVHPSCIGHIAINLGKTMSFAPSPSQHFYRWLPWEVMRGLLLYPHYITYPHKNCWWHTHFIPFLLVTHLLFVLACPAICQGTYTSCSRVPVRWHDDVLHALDARGGVLCGASGDTCRGVFFIQDPGLKQGLLFCMFWRKIKVSVLCLCLQQISKTM